MSQRLKDLGHRLALKHGIRELKPGESRPENYYIGNRATGRPFISSDDAVVRAEPDRAEPSTPSSEAVARPRDA